MDERGRLLAAIASDPDAIENWLVYADWLCERDDARGELITLELAIERGDASAEAVERHRALVRDEAALLSPRLEQQAHHLELELWRGFIRRAAVFGPPDDPPTRDVLDALYADPHACLLRALNLGPHAALCETLCCESVRELALDTSETTEIALATAFPMLESLDIAHLGDPDRASVLAHLAHPRLAHLHGECPALSGEFELPALRSLFVYRELRRLFEPGAILVDPPRLLEELEVPFASAAFVRELRASGLCGQLRRLSVGLDDDIVDELARDPVPFAHLDLRAYGHVDTGEERAAILARVARVLPRAQLNITIAEEVVPDEEVPRATLEPAVAQGIGDAITAFAQRLRQRGS